MKTEAKNKYAQHLRKLSSIEAAKKNKNLQAEEQLCKTKLYEKRLVGWLVEYSNNNQSQQKADLEKYIWTSGYFDFYPEAKKKDFFDKTGFPENLKEPHRALFYEFLTQDEKQIR